MTDPREPARTAAIALAARKRKRHQVSNEDFIKAWQTSSTPQVAAKRLRLSLQRVWARCKTLRKMGVELKCFVRVTETYQVKQLQDLAKKLEDDQKQKP